MLRYQGLAGCFVAQCILTHLRCRYLQLARNQHRRIFFYLQSLFISVSTMQHQVLARIRIRKVLQQLSTVFTVLFIILLRAHLDCTQKHTCLFRMQAQSYTSLLYIVPSIIHIYIHGSHTWIPSCYCGA